MEEPAGQPDWADRMDREAELVEELALVRADRDWNFAVKMAFEGCLRDLEGRRRLKRGTVDRLLATV